MEDSEIPQSVKYILGQEDEYFCMYSYCESDDRTKAVIGGGGEDPDFPQIYTFDLMRNLLKEIDTKSELIDFPLGRTYWDKNQTDIIVQNYYDNALYRLSYHAEKFILLNMEKVESDSEYHKNMASKIEDLVRPDNNANEDDLAKKTTSGDPYKTSLLEFANGFVETSEQIRKLCIASRGAGADDWTACSLVFSFLESRLSQVAEENGILGELPDLKKHLSPLDSSDFIPVIGKTYDISWGKFLYKGKVGAWESRVRIDGLAKDQWIDVRDNKPLDPELASLEVKWFQEI